MKFTAEIWHIEDDRIIINEKLTIIEETHFPYLDMEMFWNNRNELKFQVHMKPNKNVMYLNGDSNHLPANFEQSHPEF